MSKKTPSAPSNLKSKISKSQPLKVLVVEDSEDDALLEIRELKKGGYNPVYERVETAAAMKKALREKQWDIILCDYKLPKFNAPSAIAVLKETNIDIPIIIVSGTIGEDTAVECMRSGAQDYIMKNNLARLCLAIARELEEADSRRKHNQVEETLHQSEEKYRNLVERANDGIGIAQDGILRYTNSKLVQIGGYSVEEVIGKPFIDFFTAEEVPKVLDRYKRRMAGKKVTPVYETALKHKNGSRIDVEVNAGAITYEGKPADLVLVRDITERKKAEEILSKSEERFRISVKSVSDCIWEWDIEKASLDWFGDIDSLLGYRRNDFPRTIDAWEKAIHPEDHDTVMSLLDKHIADHTPYNTKYRVVKKDGSIAFWVDTGTALRDENGKAYKMIGAVKDITERKRAEEALHESEKRFRALIEHSHDAITLLTADGTVLYDSPSILHVLGYDPTERLGRSVFEYVHPEERQNMAHGFAKFTQQVGAVASSQVRFLRKDGTPRQIEGVRTNLLHEPAIRAVVVNYRDITERRQAEEELRKSEEKYRTILESIEEGYYEVDLAGNLTFFNDSICRISGYTREESMGANNRLYADEDTVKNLFQAFNEVYRTEKTSVIYDYELIRKDGTKAYIAASISLRKDAAGKKIGFRGIMRDITKRKQAEEELRKSEESFRLSLDDSPLGVCIVTEKGETLYANKATLEIYGYDSIEELRGTPLKNRYTPESYAEFKIRKEKRGRGEFGPSEYEISIVRKNGKVRHVHVFRKEVWWNGARQFQIIYQDISERKQAGEELRKSEEKYRNILENIEDGYYEVDLNGNFTFFNTSMCRILGYPQEEMMGMNNRQFTDKENAKKLFKTFNEVYRTGEPAKEFDWQIIRKDGTKRYIEVSVSLQKNSSGKPIGFRGISQDITERKQAENELLLSERKYRSLVENAQEGIYQSTPAGRHLTVNRAFANMLGYESPKEVIQTITDIAQQLYVNPEDRKKILQLVEKHGSVKGYEAEFYRKDGSRIWVSINMHAVRDEQGSLLYYQGIDQDITEKKKIEAERQENIERLRKSLGATINAMAVTVETRDPYTAGHQRRVADLARAIAVEMNLKSEQIDSVRMASMIHDIGKISIPSEILTKPTQLTSLEFNLIKTHPASGYNILKDIEFPWPIARIVLEHHERIDGSGYPSGLKGEQLLLESRIIAIADVVEAISSHRPYRAAQGIDAGLDEITKNRGLLYDPDLVDACLRLFREKNYNLAV